MHPIVSTLPLKMYKHPIGSKIRKSGSIKICFTFHNAVFAKHPQLSYKTESYQSCAFWFHPVDDPHPTNFALGNWSSASPFTHSRVQQPLCTELQYNQVFLFAECLPSYLKQILGTQPNIYTHFKSVYNLMLVLLFEC